LKKTIKEVINEIVFLGFLTFLLFLKFGVVAQIIKMILATIFFFGNFIYFSKRKVSGFSLTVEMINYSFLIIIFILAIELLN